MHDTGALTALFPEMEQIECLVVRDFYHRYTVDEHTLVALQNLWSLRDADELPLKPYGDLLREMPRPGALVFALLFHDSGKGSAGEGHVDASMRLAQSAMARIQVPPQERETILFLIRRHLELSAVMQARDLFDPQTKTFTEPAEQVMKEIAALKADKSVSDAGKKESLAELLLQDPNAPAVKRETEEDWG